ncbi:MAG: hypothetical protein ABJC13_12605 [Acidobacteriota bacterium]
MKPELDHSVSVVRVGRIARFARLAAVLAGFGLGATALQAQELYTFTVGVLGGIAGSPDTQSTSFDRQSLQLNLQFETDARTQVGIRVGQVDLTGQGERLNGLFEPKLQYVTIGGEYRTRQSYYDSGIFISLGGYRLEGSGGSSKTAAGLSAGATGEFTFNRHFGVIAEVAVHYADLDDLQYFGSGQIGLAFHF